MLSAIVVHMLTAIISGMLISILLCKWCAHP